MPENVGDILRRLREARGLSKKKLAKLSGVDRGRIAQIEKGVRDNLTIKTARKLAPILGVSPAVLFGDTKDTGVDTKDALENLPEQIMRTIMDKLEQQYDKLGFRVLPLRGTVPAGSAFPEEQREGDFVIAPKELAGGLPENAYALSVCGNWTG